MCKLADRERRRWNGQLVVGLRGLRHDIELIDEPQVLLKDDVAFSQHGSRTDGWRLIRRSDPGRQLPILSGGDDNQFVEMTVLAVGISAYLR